MGFDGLHNLTVILFVAMGGGRSLGVCHKYIYCFAASANSARNVTML